MTDGPGPEFSCSATIVTRSAPPPPPDVAVLFRGHPALLVGTFRYEHDGVPHAAWTYLRADLARDRRVARAVTEAAAPPTDHLGTLLRYLPQVSDPGFVTYREAVRAATASELALLPAIAGQVTARTRVIYERGADEATAVPLEVGVTVAPLTVKTWREELAPADEAVRSGRTLSWLSTPVAW